MSERASRRGILLVLGAIVVGAAAVLLALAQPWWHRASGGAGMPVVEEPVTGGELFGSARAAALAALAGVLAIVATRRIGRIVAGAVVLLAGLVAAVPVGSSLLYALVAEPRTDEAATGGALDPFLRQLHEVSSWGYVTFAGGALIVIGAVLTIARGRHWPAMGRKYEAGGASGAGAAEARADSTATIDADEAWRSLDRGEDPTR